MATLEEILANIQKNLENIQTQLNEQREEHHKSMESIREEIAHDLGTMRSEVDARIGEAFKSASGTPPPNPPAPRKDKAKVVNLGGVDRATSSKGDYPRMTSPRESHPSQDGSQDDRHENEPMDLQDDEETRGTPRGPRMAVGREPNPRVNREDRGKKFKGLNSLFLLSREVVTLMSF